MSEAAAFAVPHIRLMTEQDIPLGMRLKTQAGWNQALEDWRRFLAMQPEGWTIRSQKAQHCRHSWVSAVRAGLDTR